MSSTKVQGLARAILILCVPVILIATPLFLLWRPSYLRLQYGLSGFPASSRFSDSERLRLSDTIMRYTIGDAMLEEMATIRTDAGARALLATETQHLVDVAVVVQGFYRAGAVALAVAVLAGVYLFRASAARLVSALRAGTGLTLAFLLVIGLTALVDFELFFTLMHGVFFKSGTWTFFYEDTLIQLYPLPFWTNAILHLSTLIGAMSLAFLGLAHLVDRRIRREAAA
jgi:integral membrane protein (TIGR01906 family)